MWGLQRVQQLFVFGNISQYISLTSPTYTILRSGITIPNILSYIPSRNRRINCQGLIIVPRQQLSRIRERDVSRSPADLRFEIYSTDESGRLNLGLRFGAAHNACRKLVSVFGRGHDYLVGQVERQRYPSTDRTIGDLRFEIG